MFSGDQLLVELEAFQPSRLETWNWKTSTLLSREKLRMTPELCRLRSSDQSIGVTTDSDGNVEIWEREPKKQIGQLQVGGKHLRNVAVAPDGTQIATTRRSGAYPLVQIWNPVRSRKTTVRHWVGAVPG